MRRFIIISLTIIILYFVLDTAYYRWGWYLPVSRGEAAAFVKTEGKTILLDEGDGFQPFEIRGVDMGVGIPGHFATDYAIDKETYLRWFRMIQDMGANTVRVYTIQSEAFYDAVFEYNKENPHPLWILHGVWVNDYVQYSHVDAYDDSFRKTFLDDCRTLVDIIHGKRKLDLGEGVGSGYFDKDISPWVIGYILGVEWEDTTVAYTDHMQAGRKSYVGEYMYASEDASPFESMLAEVGDHIIKYESNRYGQQRLLAFSNWPTTDPFQYPDSILQYFRKAASVDVEHIHTTDRFLSGHFASYHVYPYFPDYLNYFDEWKTQLNVSDFLMETGKINTYCAYLTLLNKHHQIPVVISEYGVPSARGMAQKDQNTTRAQGFMSEKDQGEAIIECYEDIRAAGCAGSIIFTWQDEWFKRTWNTMHAVDLTKTPYWSDYQTNEQYFGLLGFDPGRKESVCYVDGEIGEWGPEDLIWKGDGKELSVKADEKYVYFMTRIAGGSEDNGKIYIPIDITPKSGSNYDQTNGIKFERDADFVVVIDGENNSRIMVQERYEVLHAMFSYNVEGRDAYLDQPERNSPTFKPISLILQTPTQLIEHTMTAKAETYETGKLTYGDGNPSHKDFNSLADYMVSGDILELRLPWQILNFSNPAEQQVHDDYYEHYGVENLKIDSIYAGLGCEAEQDERIMMGRFPLKGWGRYPAYHERLKQSYYMIKDHWNGRSGK